MLKKIISGGQTGADQAGLFFGRDFGYETGGWAPRGWHTEEGPHQAMLRGFHLTEWREPGYLARTSANVGDSDGTVILGDPNSIGSRATLSACVALGKPHHVVLKIQGAGEWAIVQFRDWLDFNEIEVLNVAGNRESVTPGIYQFTYDFLLEALKEGT